MIVKAVRGAAGCGKTFRLMSLLNEELASRPLIEGQKVLALTFMHGARRRLESKLLAEAGLGGRFEAKTMDSFCVEICMRWRSLLIALGIELSKSELHLLGEGSFDKVCASAGKLLESEEVVKWIARTYPIILVDEGQDLTSERVAVLRGLSTHSKVLIALDEFQCLDEKLRVNPCAEWVLSVCQPEELTVNHRTSVNSLLRGAGAIRRGLAPISGGELRIYPVPSKHVASAFIANAIAWSKGGRIAIITPSRAGFVLDSIEQVTVKACGKLKHGPYLIKWEESGSKQSKELFAGLMLSQECTLDEIILAVAMHQKSEPVRQTIKWLQRQTQISGTTTFSRDLVEAAFERRFALKRQFVLADSARRLAMTVHQAKNREFEEVIVMWPYQIAGDAEQRRRLLYNAVTRAKQRCTILVQGSSIPVVPPFV